MAGNGSDFGGFSDFGEFGDPLGSELGGSTGLGGAFSDAGWGTGMDAWGGYGNDLGVSSPTDGFDYGIGIDPGKGWAPIGYDDTEVNMDDTSFMGTLQSFMQTPIGQVVNGFLSVNPATSTGMAIANAGLAAYTGQYGPAVGLGVSALTGNSALGSLANIGTQAAQGQNVGSSLGGFIGGQIGGQATGSQLGGMVGSQLGGMVGQSIGTSGINPGAPSPTSVGNQGMDFGGALANIADIYSANRASRDIGRNINSMQANSPQVSLDALYGPNSPYAAQLRQQLERKDAASGRRSQYGPREVELQARLADMYSRAAPGIMNANTQNINAIAQQQALQAQRRNQTLASIYGLARSSGALKGIGNTFQNSGINSNLNYISNIVPDNSLDNYISDSFREYM